MVFFCIVLRSVDCVFGVVLFILFVNMMLVNIGFFWNVKFKFLFLFFEIIFVFIMFDGIRLGVNWIFENFKFSIFVIDFIRWVFLIFGNFLRRIFLL